MITVEQALDLLQQTVRPLPIETVPLEQLAGRFLMQGVFADVDSPPHDKSVMDGFAVRSQDVQPSAEFEVLETVAAGQNPGRALGLRQATRIMTGAPIPENADAVIMVELADCAAAKTNSDVLAEQVRFRIDSVDPEQHILRRGANFSRGQPLFASGHPVRPTEIGLLAEVGCASADVSAQPSVAVLPTGDELVDCDQLPAAGQIRNSNGPMLAALTRAIGLPTVELGIGRDEKRELQALIERGLEQDLLILTGGVSMGQKDLVPGLLTSLGVSEVFHKVMVKPGKPVWFGYRDRGNRRTLVFGLPGNPVSSLVGFQLFVRPSVSRLMGASWQGPSAVSAQLTRAHQTRGNRPTFWPASCEISDQGRLMVQPLEWHGSSDLLALGKADGLIAFPADRPDHAAGSIVSYLPFDR